MNFLPYIGVALWITQSFPIIRMILLILMVVLSIAMVIVVMIQPSNSDGKMGAISGQSSETFYSKNKGHSLAGMLKRLTIVMAICLFVVSVLFFVTVIIYPVGAMV